MKAYVCCVLFAAALAAPEPRNTQRDKRGLVPAAGLINPYSLGGYGLGLGHAGLYGSLAYPSLGYGAGLGYGLGYGAGLGYSHGLGLGHGLGYGGLRQPVPVLAVAVSKNAGESEHHHGNHKGSGEKKAAPEAVAVHAIPALPTLGGLHGLHGLPAAHALPIHGLPAAHPLW